MLMEGKNSQDEGIAQEDAKSALPSSFCPRPRRCNYEQQREFGGGDKGYTEGRASGKGFITIQVGLF